MNILAIFTSPDVPSVPEGPNERTFFVGLRNMVIITTTVAKGTRRNPPAVAGCSYSRETRQRSPPSHDLEDLREYSVLPVRRDERTAENCSREKPRDRVREE